MTRQLLAIALALPLACAAQKPDVDTFFASMAIKVAPGRQAQFVAGDNVAGYFEGYTQTATRGAGYLIKNEAVFKGYASFVGAAPNVRAGSREQVLPYGHQVRYANGATEEMALLSKQQAIALHVTSRAAARLAIRPMLTQLGAVTRSANGATFAPGAGQTLYAALAANQPFTLDDGMTVRASAPARALLVVIAFAPTPAQAQQRAQALVTADPIRAERR
ncbi:MAG: hypothetical protein WKG03_14835, partial [Telluria sp.]